MGCHFLLQCMKVRSESEVAQSGPTLSDPMDCMQPTRLLCPWDFPGKSTGVGCHFLLHGFCYQQDSNPKLLILALFFPECTQQSRCVNHAWCLIHLVLLSFIYHLLNTTLWQALLGTVNDSCCPLSSSQETTTSCFYFFLFATNLQAKPTS